MQHPFQFLSAFGAFVATGEKRWAARFRETGNLVHDRDRTNGATITLKDVRNGKPLTPAVARGIRRLQKSDKKGKLGKLYSDGHLATMKTILNEVKFRGV